MARRRIKYYSPKRRAIYAKGDNIDALVVFESHGWVCIICDEPINRKLRVPNWYAATLEHVVPLCRGGTHTVENVAPAHLICNLQKGDAILQKPFPGGQLPADLLDL